MPAPKEVLSLIAKFDQHREDYLSGRYNEAQVRKEFIDPMFKALGWDMDNEGGLAEAYKDVIHEDAIKMGGYTKAPDYCFRIGGTRKFFLEAKKPSVKVKEDIDPAFQLRRYAWTGKLPLSILTDFEELAVYDCRVKPVKTDGAATARTMYLTYDEYAERWDEIASVFSKDAVLKGSFDKYAADARGKKGTAEVDKSFLKEIESWRETLAKSLALRNKGLSTEELNYAVQTTIDRIIFLRICEDRGIEEYGRLMKLRNGANAYPRLMELFRAADQRYNSGLFHFEREKGRPESPDGLTPGLAIDDKPLKDIIKSLYYPDSPYEFSVLPADILGQVYEQFLGKVIRLTAGHRAVVEDKPEVKKAGGVYYTPTYIVDYIVKNTVGKLIEGKKPAQVAKLRILDPACGSGGFLIGAYQYLIDWHRDWYAEHDPKKHAKQRTPAIYQGAGGEWRLTTAEKKRILVNNIYGVDIDQQAVEVTKLSLLLKVLEGESQLSLFHERALPDLGDNIKCGNSLIGTDFYEGEQMALFDDTERRRVNAFDWETEFPEIMASGGFDAVIGNPPYIRMEEFKELKDYLRSNYASHDERSDLYTYFVERGHGLLRSGGRFAMIVSNKFLRANYGKPLREFLRKTAAIDQVVDFAGLPVFPTATVRTLVLVTSRDGTARREPRYSPPLPLSEFAAVAAGSLSVEKAAGVTGYAVSPESLSDSVWSFAPKSATNLLNKLEAHGRPLAEYCDGQILRGIVSGLSSAFIIDASTRDDILRRNPKAEQIIKPHVNGRDVRRYHIGPTDAYLIYAHHGVDIDAYPAVVEYLAQFKNDLGKRATRQEWYELQQPQFRYREYFEGPKIMFPDMAKTPRFALDDSGYYCSNTAYFIPLCDPYLLALLNSRLAHFYFAQTCAGLEGKNETYLRFFGQYLEGFPVRCPDLESAGDREAYNSALSLVEIMLTLHAGLLKAKTSAQSAAIERQIAAADRRIDHLVYELYGLTPAEIRTVEESTQ